MKKLNVRFLLFFIALVLCFTLFIFSMGMILQDTTIVYGAEPSATMDWGYPIVTPTISGYPILEPTEVNGYPAPQPTEIDGYPVPVPSDPRSSFDKLMPILYYASDYGNEEQPNISSPTQKLKEIIEIVIDFIKTNKIIKYYGKIIFEMR